MPQRFPCAPVVVCLLAVFCASGHAAVQDRDDTVFLRELERRGMKGLAQHLLKDAAEGEGIKALSSKIKLARLSAADPQLPHDRRRAEALRVLELSRTAIDSLAPDQWQRPLLQIDTAEWIMQAVIPMTTLHGEDAVAFGVPVGPNVEPYPEQKMAVTTLARRAERLVADATFGLREMRTMLPRRRGFQTQFVVTGLWKKIDEQYGRLRLPMIHARVVLLLHALEGRHHQLAGALEGLKAIPAKRLNPQGQARRSCRIGRLLLEAGQAKAAEPFLTESAASGPEADPRVRLRAQLSLARIALEHKDADRAREMFEAAVRSDLAKADPFALLLVFDAWARFRGDRAVYGQLEGHPVAGARAGELLGFVVQRDGLDASGDPPPLALAGLTAGVGRAVAIVDDHSRRSALAIVSSQLGQFLEREDLDTPDKGRGQYLLGQVAYKRPDPGAALELYLAAAETTAPPIGPAAANNALILSSRRLARAGAAEADHAAYEKAHEILFRRFGGSELAAVQRYDRAAYLANRQRYAEAVAAYERVASSHPRYDEARYERVLCLHAMWLAAPTPEQDALARRVRDGAERARETWKKKDSPDARRREADLLLMGAQAMAQTLADGNRAARWLKGFEARFAAFDDLIEQKRRIMISIAVGRGQLDAARAEIEAMLSADSASAGSTLQGVLLAVDKRVSRLRTANDPAWKSTSAFGVWAAQRLEAWARQQTAIAQTPSALFGFELRVAQALVLDGQNEQAMALYDRLAAMNLGTRTFTDEKGRQQTIQEKGADRREVAAARLQLLGELGREDEALKVARGLTERLKGQNDDPLFWEAERAMAGLLDARYDRMDQVQAGSALRKRAKLSNHIKRLGHVAPRMGGAESRRALMAIGAKNQAIIEKGRAVAGVGPKPQRPDSSSPSLALTMAGAWILAVIVLGLGWWWVASSRRDAAAHRALALRGRSAPTAGGSGRAPTGRRSAQAPREARRHASRSAPKDRPSP